MKTKRRYFGRDRAYCILKGPDHLQKNLFLKNHKSFAMPKKISKT